MIKRVIKVGRVFLHSRSAPPLRKIKILCLAMMILDSDSKSRICCTFLHFVTLFHTFQWDCLTVLTLYARWWNLDCTFSHSRSHTSKYSIQDTVRINDDNSARLYTVSYTSCCDQS